MAEKASSAPTKTINNFKNPPTEIVSDPDPIKRPIALRIWVFENTNEEVCVMCAGKTQSSRTKAAYTVSFVNANGKRVTYNECVGHTVLICEISNGVALSDVLAETLAAGQLPGARDLKVDSTSLAGTAVIPNVPGKTGRTRDGDYSLRELNLAGNARTKSEPKPPTPSSTISKSSIASIQEWANAQSPVDVENASAVLMLDKVWEFQAMTVKQLESLYFRLYWCGDTMTGNAKKVMFANAKATRFYLERKRNYHPGTNLPDSVLMPALEEISEVVAEVGEVEPAESTTPTDTGAVAIFLKEPLQDEAQTESVEQNAQEALEAALVEEATGAATLYQPTVTEPLEPAEALLAEDDEPDELEEDEELPLGEDDDSESADEGVTGEEDDDASFA